MVSAVLNISIFSVYFLYMLLHILFVFYYCLRQSALERLETKRAAKREMRSPDQRCDRQH